MNKDKQLKIYKFLQRHKLAVVATSGSSKSTPQSALVAYVEDENLCLYFQTGGNTRKAKNIKLNPSLSFVIGLNADEWTTLQYEGVAQQITDRQELKTVKSKFLDKQSPSSIEYLERPGAIFFQVKPNWIRYSKYYEDKHPEIIEFDDFN